MFYPIDTLRYIRQSCPCKMCSLSEAANENLTMAVNNKDISFIFTKQKNNTVKLII